MFVRFIIGEKHAASGVPQGVFSVAYYLRTCHETPPWQTAELTRTLGWFNTNLRAPRRFNRTKSKGYYHRNGMAISWFKPEATEHIAKIREVGVILEDHGYAVEMIKTLNPGYIVYEDEFQVAAIPFSSTVTG